MKLLFPDLLFGGNFPKGQDKWPGARIGFTMSSWPAVASTYLWNPPPPASHASPLLPRGETWMTELDFLRPFTSFHDEATRMAPAHPCWHLDFQKHHILPRQAYKEGSACLHSSSGGPNYNLLSVLHTPSVDRKKQLHEWMETVSTQAGG